VQHQAGIARAADAGIDAGSSPLTASRPVANDRQKQPSVTRGTLLALLAIAAAAVALVAQFVQYLNDGRLPPASS